MISARLSFTAWKLRLSSSVKSECLSCTEIHNFSIFPPTANPMVGLFLTSFLLSHLKSRTIRDLTALCSLHSTLPSTSTSCRMHSTKSISFAASPPELFQAHFRFPFCGKRYCWSVYYLVLGTLLITIHCYSYNICHIHPLTGLQPDSFLPWHWSLPSVQPEFFNAIEGLWYSTLFFCFTQCRFHAFI